MNEFYVLKSYTFILDWWNKIQSNGMEQANKRIAALPKTARKIPLCLSPYCQFYYLFLF